MIKWKEKTKELVRTYPMKSFFLHGKNVSFSFFGLSNFFFFLSYSAMNLANKERKERNIKEKNQVW